MSLGIPFDDIVRDRLRIDPAFRDESLKCAIENMEAGETRVAEKMLRLLVEATIGYQRLGELMDKPPENIKQMLQPDCATSASDLFEIIKHLQRHEGIRLEVKVSSDISDGTLNAQLAEPVEAQKPMHPVNRS